MKINKADFKDGLTFLWIAIVFFLITVNVAFPFVMFVMKIVFWIIGGLMFGLSIATLIKSIFGKNKSIDIQSKNE